MLDKTKSNMMIPLCCCCCCWWLFNVRAKTGGYSRLNLQHEIWKQEVKGFREQNESWATERNTEKWLAVIQAGQTTKMNWQLRCGGKNLHSETDRNPSV